MKNSSRNIEDLFCAKQERRKDLAKLSVEEKIKILVQLQRMALPVYLARGLEKRVWEIKTPKIS